MTELKEENLIEMAQFKDDFKAEYLQVKSIKAQIHKLIVKIQAGTAEVKPASPMELLKHQEDVLNEYLLTLELRAEIEKIELD